jgi:hypothetical protein
MFRGTGVGHVDFGDLGSVIESAQNLREYSDHRPFDGVLHRGGRVGAERERR